MKNEIFAGNIMLQAARGHSPDVIAERLGVPVGTVLQQLDIDSGTRPNKVDYEPTPDEIRRACLAIQAEWTPEEEARRRTGLRRSERDKKYMTVPTVKTPIPS